MKALIGKFMSESENKWYPGKPETELECYKRQCNELQRENKRLRLQISTYSWKINPDRMGGQLTQWEIEDARGWK